MAKQGSSQFLRVSLSAPGVTLIDYIAESSTACLAVCPHSAQHTLHIGQTTVLCISVVFWFSTVLLNKKTKKKKQMQIIMLVLQLLSGYPNVGLL